MKRVLAGLVIGAVLCACSGGLGAAPVFVGAQTTPIGCGDGRPCLRVTSEVDGSRAGTGGCILYATTSEGQVAVAASGELELKPGRIVEWIVRVPSHFDRWNPLCVPTAEG